MISLSEFLKTKPIETPEAFSVKSEKKNAFSENIDSVEPKKPFQEFLKEASQEKSPASVLAAAVPADIVEETPDTEEDAAPPEGDSEEGGMEFQPEMEESEHSSVEFGKEIRIRPAEIGNSPEIMEKMAVKETEVFSEQEEPDFSEVFTSSSENVFGSEETVDLSADEKKAASSQPSSKNQETDIPDKKIPEISSLADETDERKFFSAENRREEDITLNLTKEKNQKLIQSERKQAEIPVREQERQAVPVSERKMEIPVQQESSSGIFSNVVQKEPTYQDLLKKLSNEAKKIQIPLKEKLSEKERNEVSENTKPVPLALKSKERKTDNESSVKEAIQTRKETVRLPEEALQIKNFKETQASVQSSESQPRIEDRQIPLFPSQRQVRTEKANAELSYISNPREVLKNNFAEIVKSVRTNILENGKSQADIILHPKELGRMNILVSLEKDSLHGRIFVENENAKTVLLSDLSSLHKELKDIGVNLTSLQVDLSGNSQFAAEKGGWQEEFGSGGAQKSSYSDNSSSEETEAEYIPDPDRILDIKV